MRSSLVFIYEKKRIIKLAVAICGMISIFSLLLYMWKFLKVNTIWLNFIVLELPVKIIYLLQERLSNYLTVLSHSTPFPSYGFSGVLWLELDLALELWKSHNIRLLHFIFDLFSQQKPKKRKTNVFKGLHCSAFTCKIHQGPFHIERHINHCSYFTYGDAVVLY